MREKPSVPRPIRAIPLLLCLAAGCAGPKVFIAKSFVRPNRVAVLPMANDTNDLDGPILVREMIFQQLARRGYQLVPLAETDQILKTQGFTDGGQLGATTPQKIGEWLGTDGLFYSTLEDFNYINVGFYTQRLVKVSGRLVNAPTGERLWETERSASTRNIATNKKDAERLAATQLAIKAIEKAAHRPLQPESRMMVDNLLSTLP